MLHWILVSIVFVTVSLLIKSVWDKNARGIYVFKPLSTILIICIALLALVSPNTNTVYTTFVIAGLIFSLGGDVALMFTSDRAFIIGLVSFLTAHVVYSAGFVVLNGFFPQDVITAALLLALAVGIYLYLYSGLGKMKFPVALYTLVISFMVWRAISTLFGTTFSLTQAILLSIGAILFYLSDVILAINKFKSPRRWYRPLNLATYYGGQLLIALSTI